MILLKSGQAAFCKKDETRYDFVLSTDTVDRVGDTIDQKGWLLENFQKNPIVLFNHDYAKIVGRARTVKIEDGALVAEDLEFAPTPFGQEIKALVDGGFINATSVGLNIVDATWNEKRGGLDILKQELLEFSLVAVPANPEALRKEKSLRDECINAVMSRNSPEVKETKQMALSPEDLAAIADMLKAERNEQIKKEISGAPAIAKFTDRKAQPENEKTSIGRWLIASYRAKQLRTSLDQAAANLGWHELAERCAPQRLQKAVVEGVETYGGFLAPVEVASQIIEMPQAKTILNRAGVPTIQMNTHTMRWTREITNPSVAYVGEQGSATNSTPSWDAPILQLKKFAAETIIARDMLRDASVSMQEYITNRLVAAMARFEDLKFFEGTGSINQVEGIASQVLRLYSTNTTNTYTASSGLTGPLARVDLIKLRQMLATANIDISANAFFACHGQVYNKIVSLVDGSAGKPYFDKLGPTEGEIEGSKIYTSSALSTTTTSRRMFFVEPSQMVIGRGITNEVEFADTYVSGGTTYSANAQDSECVRVWSRHDLLMMQPSAAAYIYNLDWA